MHRIQKLVPRLASAFLVLLPLAPAATALPRNSAAAQGARDEVLLPASGTLVVTRSTRVKAGEYLRPPQGEDLRAGVILLEKLENVSLDLRGVVLRGADAKTPQDELSGFGIVVRDCKNVTISGGKLSGYGGCLVVERSSGVVIEDLQFDRWYAMRLLSSIAAENGADWLWPHENDQGQWLTRYGGAISLSDSPGATVRRCKGRHGQNGILMLRSDGAQVYDNDFSFLSGWGLALYRTSKCMISRNIFDYCVRGYSHGVYWRGQDSAAILMFERCSDNQILYNSATHSGDGIFLFAGRDAVEGKAFERGEAETGGSDRNLFYANDFSYAVANGIEATFSSENRCIANTINGCHQHGVWGGYSNKMTLYGNRIEGTLGGAITIEHGQEILIAENVLHENQIGVELYWDEDPDLVKGPFGKRFDTRSRGSWVFKNSFLRNDSDFVVSSSQELAVGENVFAAHNRELSVSNVRSSAGAALDTLAVRALLTGIGGWSASGRLKDVSMLPTALDAQTAPPALARELAFSAPEAPGTQRAFDPDADDGEGLETIVMGEWGPWDFRSKEPRPPQRLPGGLLVNANWDAVWFSWKGGPDPRGDAQALAAWRALSKTPLASARIASWYTPHGADAKVAAAVGQNHFGLRASTKVSLESGRYRLAVVSDDGVRVSVDGHAVLENWTWHAPTRDVVEVELEAGEHEFELEYFQIDGASALSLDLEPVP